MKLPDIDPEKITTLVEAKNAIEKLLQLFIKQQTEIQRLQAEIARLKGQPRKPQFVTSTRSSFGMSKLLSEKGKKWHKGVKKGMLSIDRHVDLVEKKTCMCGSHEFKSVRTTTKIVQGILFKRDNVAYHGRVKQCVRCGKTYKSNLPGNIQGISFDTNLRSLLSYLKFSCRMTQPLIHRMLSGFGITISKGEIDHILLKNSNQLQSAHQHLKTVGFGKSSHLQSDATGAKRKEKTGDIKNQYVQIIANSFLSVFSVTRYYNIATLNRLLGTHGRKKPFVSDDGSPNGDGLHVRYKQLCWVHEIRHYKKLFPFFNPHQKLQNQILTQWREFYHLAKHYRDDPIETKRNELEEQFDRITSQITGYDLLDKQLRLTRKKHTRLLLFLDYPDLPIHNNQCEQDLREFVIQRKISHETKSVRGDRSIARHLSVIQTAQKQRLDVFQTLHGLLTGQLSPAILTAHIQ